MKKILVVDDEKGIRDILKYILSREGYEVHVAKDGKEAIEKVHALSPDLMILDAMMPEVDGYEVCKRIRKSTIYSKLPILMISANSESEYELKGLSVGADDYIIKPFDNSELFARIKVQLDI